MRQSVCELGDGIMVGGTAYRNVVLKELTAGELIDAKLASEELRLVPVSLDEYGHTISEPQLVVSPMKMAIETLRRQVVSIGKISGPLELDMLRKLSTEDFNLLLAGAEQLDQAASLEVAQKRGRSDSGGEADA